MNAMFQRDMPSLLVLCLPFVFVLVIQLTVVSCGKYTVTDEAWFDVFVEDFDGNGQSFRGRFTIALFGETAPMTVMNFAGLVKGITRRNKVKATYGHNPAQPLV